MNTYLGLCSKFLAVKQILSLMFLWIQKKKKDSRQNDIKLDTEDLTKSMKKNTTRPKSKIMQDKQIGDIESDWEKKRVRKKLEERVRATRNLTLIRFADMWFITSLVERTRCSTGWRAHYGAIGTSQFSRAKEETKKMIGSRINVSHKARSLAV